MYDNLYDNNQVMENKWGGKRKGAGRKKTEYKQFMSARLEDDLHEWLKKENGRYKSWNQFFREIKKRYESRKDA